MRQSYQVAVLVAVLLACQTFTNAQVKPLCGKAKALTFTTACAQRSSIIEPTTESWSFNIAAGSKFGAVVSVRFIGPFRGLVQVKGAGGAVLNTTSHPGTKGEHVFAAVKEAGAYTLEVTPYYANTPVIYLARAQAAADVQLSAAHQKSLAGIATACCTGVKSAACDLLAAPATICSSAPNACDEKGNLVWLSLVGGLSCPTGINGNGELEALATVNTLDLSYNGLSQPVGTIAPALLEGNMEALEYVYLAHNKFAGVLMEDDFALTQPIKVWDFTNNSLTGKTGSPPLPLFQQEVTEEVHIGWNNFTDSWSGINENCINFQVVDVSHNAMNSVGSIFTSPLIYVDVSNNRFERNFHVPNVTESIVYYDASSNNVVTTVPPVLHDAPRLAYLDVSNNKVDGQLDFLLAPPTNPEMAFKCTKLSVLKLNDNSMSGFIYFSISNFTQLRTLEIQNNRFQGNLINMAAGLTANNVLTTLNVSGNDFVGPVPNSFRNLAGLSPKDLPKTYVATNAGVVAMETPRSFDVSNCKNISGDFPVFVVKAEAAIRQAYAAKGSNALVDFKISDGSNTFSCPTANNETLDAADVFSIQTDGYTCYTPDNRQIGLEDALFSVVPGLPAPPPPPKDLYPPGPPAKADEKLKIIGICLGVGLALALAVAGIFAYKWRDLDLKIKSRYHKQGEDFKPSYVVSPRADAKNGEDQENGGGKRTNGFDGVV